MSLSTLSGSEKVIAIAEKLSDEIASDTLADSIVAGDIEGYSKEWDINGERITIGVKCI